MYIDNPITFNGAKLFIVPARTCTHEEKRTWKQRLFTLPFHPFVRSTTVSKLIEVLKDGEIIQNSDGIFMNNKTFHEFKNYIPNV